MQEENPGEAVTVPAVKDIAEILWPWQTVV